MNKCIWLHIGTSKSGTTALQHSFSENAEFLRDEGLSYIKLPRVSSVNKLAVAINRNRQADIDNITKHLVREIEDMPTQTGIISSEMLFGMHPTKIYGALPILRDVELKVLVYLRRQDRYIESKYFQKLKNLRFRGTIEDYIVKFHGSGSDYLTQIQPWLDLKTNMRVRICEPARLFGGSTVTDALKVMGFENAAKSIPQRHYANTSPSLERIQLLQALGDAGHPDVKRIQRALAPDPLGKAKILSLQEKRAFLSQYELENETLRALYFPEQEKLFDLSDLDDPNFTTSVGFTPEQLQEITAIFEMIMDRK